MQPAGPAETKPQRKRATNRGVVIAVLSFFAVIGLVVAINMLKEADDPPPPLSASTSLVRARSVLARSVPKLRSSLAAYSNCTGGPCVSELRTTYGAAQAVELDVTVLSNSDRFTFPEGYSNDLDDLESAASAFIAKAGSYLRCVDGPTPDHCDSVPAPSANDLSDPGGAEYLGYTLRAFER